MCIDTHHTSMLTKHRIKLQTFHKHIGDETCMFFNFPFAMDNATLKCKMQGHVAASIQLSNFSSREFFQHKKRGNA